jgi:osmoprotectant transport system substrate-binding protein
MVRRIFLAVAAVTALALGVAGCGSSGSSKSAATSSSGSSGAASSGGKVVVGSADFSESEVLANLYVLLLQDAGYSTEMKTVTTREIYEPALENGQIDIVPEYVASITEFLNHKVNGANAPTVATNDPTATLAQLNKLAEPLGLKALEFAKAADANAFAVTKDFAAKHNLKTLSDLGNAKLPVKVAAPAECEQRDFCGGALKKDYGINVTKFDPFEFDSVPGKKAVQDGNDDLVEVASDDGTLDQFNLVILDDDKGVQQAQNVLPFVGKKYKDDAKFAAALNKLAPVLTSEDLGKLNAQVDNEKQKPEDVAKAYLVDKGLIKK